MNFHKTGVGAPVNNDRDMTPRYDIEFIEPGKYTQIALVGRVTQEAVLTVLNQISDDDRHSGRVGILWDFREASFDEMTLSAMRSMWQHQIDHKMNTSRRVALVYRDDVNRTILALWVEVASSSTGTERRCFTDIGDARNWLTGVDGPPAAG